MLRNPFANRQNWNADFSLLYILGKYIIIRHCCSGPSHGQLAPMGRAVPRRPPPSFQKNDEVPFLTRAIISICEDWETNSSLLKNTQ